VIALTSSREERDVERAYDLNVNGYVVKSIDFSDYRATLQALAKYWGKRERAPARFRGTRSRSIAARAAKARNTHR
jgi:DNA-binding NarL/FixJ family response regulator